jgi:hypothetical protein
MPFFMKLSCPTVGFILLESSSFIQLSASELARSAAKKRDLCPSVDEVQVWIQQAQQLVKS